MTNAVPSTLLERNSSWSSSVSSAEPELLQACAKGQSPKVLWVGCADSRVPESVVCEAKPGEIFVTRNVANQFNPSDDSAMSVLTYGIQALGVEHGASPRHKGILPRLTFFQWSWWDTLPAAAWRQRLLLPRHLARLLQTRH